MISVVGIPLIQGWSNITIRKMQGLNRNTVTCFMNPAQAFFNTLIIIIKGDLGLMIDILKHAAFVDWLLFSLQGVCCLMYQSFRYMAI